MQVSKSYFIGFTEEAVSDIFKNTNERQFSIDTLGYYDYGIFPFCRTLSDLTKFVNAINNLDMEPRERKITHYVCPKDIPELGWEEGMSVSLDDYANEFTRALIAAFFKPGYAPLVKTFPGGRVIIEGTVTEDEWKTIFYQ